MRQCNQCDFKTDADAATDLERMADHLATHNPNPAQWAEAYSRIQRARYQATRKPKEE